MPLSNLAGLYGLLEGIAGGTDILQQQQSLRQREQLFNQEQASERLKAQAISSLLAGRGGGGGVGGALGGGMPFGQPQQQMIPPAPLPQVPQATAQMNAPGGGLPQGQTMAPNLAGSNVNWQGEDPRFRGAVSNMLQAAPEDVRAASSVDSARRSTEEQAALRAKYLAGTGGLAAPPGQSLHERGLAADWQFANPQADRWVHQNAGRFGLDFPLGARDPNHMQLAALKNDTAQAGMAALQAGVPQSAARDMVQTGQAAINDLDYTKFGVYSLPQIAQAVEKASSPNTDPVVKSMAIGGLMKLLQPQDQMIYRALMAQNRDALQIWKTQYTQDEQDRRLRELEAGKDVRAETGGLMPYQPPGGGPPVAFSTKTGAVSPIAGLPSGSTRVGQPDPEERIPPQTQAFNAFMKAHPNATAEQQQQFLLSGRQPRSAQGMALRTFIDEFTAEHGKPPGSEDIRNFQAGTAEAVTEARGVGTRVSSLETAAQVLDGMTPLLEEASNKVNRTEYPTINKLILAYQEGTGDPDVVKYGEMLNEIRYLYGRALGGGAQARVADLNHFDEVMNRAWSKGQVKAGIEQIQKSIAVEREVLQKRRKDVGRGGREAPTAKTQDQQTGGDSVPVPDSLKNEDDGTPVRNKSDGSIWVKRGNRLIRAPEGAEPPPAGQ